MRDSRSSPSARCSPVQQDWRAWLPEEQAAVFRKNEQHLESLYNMFSIALNDAIELKQAGCLVKARLTLHMTAELCRRLAFPIAGLLRALHEHARHFGLIPCAAPLDAANFHVGKSQRSARTAALLSRVLLSQRVQFLQKVHTVAELVEDLDIDFRSTAVELADGLCIDPMNSWDLLDASHYDLNTCFRETLVLFKSFLVVLPAGQLAAFEGTILEQCHAPGRPFSVPQTAPQHRRIAAFAGQ